MPDVEAPREKLGASDSQDSINSVIESLPSESDSPTSSDIDFDYGLANSSSITNSDTDDFAPDSDSTYDIIRIPIEQNLKQLLIKVTQTSDLDSVTKLKLRVIARDFSLQRLPAYIPHLKELNLEGSALLSLRDLGCDLNHLSILRVTRCGLNSLDGLFGLQSLVELYAAANNIKDLSPCASLPNIEVLDLSKNQIRDVTSVSFLGLCTTLKHLYLEDCPTSNIDDYRTIIKELLPSLESLDSISYIDQDRSVKTCPEEKEKERQMKIASIFPAIPQRGLQKEIYFEGGVVKLPKRPHTTGSIGLSTSSPYTKNTLPVRPSTARPSTARRTTDSDFACIVSGSDIRLKDIRRLFVPSKLTSGSPVGGNPALALRERLNSIVWDNPNK